MKNQSTKPRSNKPNKKSRRDERRAKQARREAGGMPDFILTEYEFHSL